MIQRIQKFLSQNILPPKGILNESSTFQLIRINRFGGVREQTNNLTDILLLKKKDKQFWEGRKEGKFV